jgi:hypothetical protein
MDHYDLVAFLRRQRKFSEATFGPGDRTKGISEHIRRELDEIAKCFTKEEALEEWVDVIILALDQMWRLGAKPEKIVDLIELKYCRNMARRWPDWRSFSKDEPIEHDRSGEL